MLKIYSIILLAIALTFIGCVGEDLCENITCLNEGICNNGDCECPLGFEGATCETESRTKFLGFYIYDSGTCTNFSPSLEFVADTSNVTALIVTSISSSGSSLETSFSLETANSVTTSSGLLKGVYSDNTFTLTGFGCDDVYIKQ